MSFNTAGGILFALLVVIGCYFIREKRFQNLFLLGASFYFYATSSLVYSLLLVLVIGIGYQGGLLLGLCKQDKKQSRFLLGLAVALLLGILGVFKYYDFFVTSFAATLSSFGLDANFATLNIVLPVGVSFYIFQTIGYLIDVYRGDTKAEEDIFDFALFVSFFPQLVAGPIERSHNLLRQIKIDRNPLTLKDVQYGTFLIAQGFVKKTVIADNLAPTVDLIFSEESISSPIIWVGLVLFAVQIYCDFSGYTDIARGYSRLLGFRIVLNFDRPYVARSPSNFWRRWHISLSSWFTEYVYFSLGGNRSKSAVRRSGNVLSTMALSGIWHGASWNFLLWGIYHGATILFGRVIGLAVPERFRKSRVLGFLGIVFTFILSVYGWLYFRITDISKIWTYNIALVNDWSGSDVATAFLSGGALYIFLWIVIDALEVFWLKVHEHEVRHARSVVIYTAMLFVIALVLHAESPANFIYFRF